MRLWLVRHGPTHARTLIGRTERPADLSDTAALGRLAAALPDAPVVSSDLGRARATADALARGRPRLADVRGLREFDYGAWEDRPFAEFDGPLSRAFFERPGDVAPPGGESWNAVERRAVAAVDALAADHAELIAVAHFGVILILWARAAGLPPAAALAQPVEPLSLTRIDWAPPRAHYANRCP
ncbi:histidine phosphatase family protein [Jannaschia sp. W003]|uniref:histidine phosphatase family protein n=1 Tax=Jannaschia sp. W003 TaxID=2867012 RepID=UPI0021A52A92|nr:histidine phosphatase family protein [Jannaschia sp. W003]UWQ22204.1 histidine phosphatase family protein [Jannaschia sp. W003]